MNPLAALFVVAALALASTSPADAKGCLKGAVVGGVAGHYAGHHGVLGAAAGCLYGRHRAKEQERLQQGQGQPPAGQEKMGGRAVEPRSAHVGFTCQTATSAPSLRAKRSNPAFAPSKRKLDCFVASAPRNDG